MIAMKTVQLQNPVYGALWGVALDSDRDENDILRRLLGMTVISNVPAASGSAPIRAATGWVDGGFRDPRYGVLFPEGFTIFRSYRGKNYSARVFNGKWVMPDREVQYDSLNSLNKAIGAGTENAWFSWNYVDSRGRRKKIGELRNPEEVRKRQKNKSDPEESEPLV
jgi:hypothetical protein